jgi:hypothetical protein
MTLCISAACQDEGKPCILVSSDWKAELGDVASTEAQNKLYWLFSGKFAVLIAGTASAAHSLLATLKEEIKPRGITESNIGDRISEGVLRHKAKLIDNEVRRRHGVAFEHFRTRPSEFDQAQWSETWAKATQLELDCQLIVCTFIDKETYMFQVESDVSVWRDENFLTIGTGSTIANSILCFRKQCEDYPLADTLYNVFEATMFARKVHTPGVGRTHSFSVLYSGSRQKRLRGRGFETLTEFFRRYGPHSVPDLVVPNDCWEEY